ncbi:MAG TPA: hypothetical protein C5S51_08600 [Methanosarcinaceae archaeon]|nr:hypothetical protein [Methanosarcinaceae archaeon]
MPEIDFERRIFDELVHIKAELSEIKEHMVDVDTFLTEDERHIVKESFEHENEGKLISLSDFKKEIGL